MTNNEGLFSPDEGQQGISPVIGAEYAGDYQAPEVRPEEPAAFAPEATSLAHEAYGQMLGEVVANGLAWQTGDGITSAGDSVASFIEKNHDKLERTTAERVFADARRLSHEQTERDEDEFIGARKVADNLLQAADEVHKLLGRIREGEAISEQSVLNLYDTLRTASTAHGEQSAAVFNREHLRREEQAAQGQAGKPNVRYSDYQLPPIH